MSTFQNGQLASASIELTGRDLQILYNVLDEAPGKITRELVTKIQTQVQRQVDDHERLLMERQEQDTINLREQHRQELLNELRQQRARTARADFGPESGLDIVSDNAR